MKDLKQVATTLKQILKENGITKFALQLTEAEKHEFNADQTSFNLYRTLYDNTVDLTVYDGLRQASVKGNSFEDFAIKNLVEDALASVKAATEDSAHDIAPFQGEKVFRKGQYEPDIKLFFDRTKEFYNDMQSFGLVKIMLYMAYHRKAHTYYENSNASCFEQFTGYYAFTVEYAANDGINTTGLDVVDMAFYDLSKPFIQMPGVKNHIQNTINSIKTYSPEGKFTGPVILTPAMAAEFAGVILSNFVSGMVIMDGTSPWKDSIGHTVASDCLNISLKSSDKNIVGGECFTDDGFITEDVAIISNGVLKNHLLSLYFANKTGKPVVKNTSSDLVIENGTQKLEDLIKNIDKGLLLGGFSGGQPGTSGEFSGVAKNSFLIENGKITKAVSETMVNGNFLELLKKITGISSEFEANGSYIAPYIRVDDCIVISGK